VLKVLLNTNQPSQEEASGVVVIPDWNTDPSNPQSNTINAFVECTKRAPIFSLVQLHYTIAENYIVSRKKP